MMRPKMTMKKYENSKSDKAMDKKMGVKENSPADKKMDRAAVAKANKGKK